MDIALVDSASRLALFRDLEQPELELLLPDLEEASFGEGSWVVRRGQMDPGLYIIVDGEVSVVLEGEELAALTAGSFFGLYVPPAQVEDFLLANPKVMYRMLQTEARRLRTTDELRT